MDKNMRFSNLYVLKELLLISKGKNEMWLL